MTCIKTGMTLACVLALTACGDFRGNNSGLNGNSSGVDSSLTDVNNPMSVGYFNQTIGDRVLFQVDQSILTPTAISTLDGQVSWLLENTNFTTTIEGHADERGTREYNLALGERRANAVQSYLLSQGASRNQIEVVSYGEEKPAMNGHDQMSWEKNRRVEIVYR